MAPCACGKGKTTTATKTYVHTAPNGERKTYKSEVEAVAAQKRLGGTYRAQ
jgi:hypothetical protein